MQEVDRIVRDYIDSIQDEPFVPGKTRVPLVVPQFGSAEVIEAIHSLLSTYVTMGEKVRKFEGMFSKYMGTRGAVMVNAGSSAVFLALSVLSSPRFKDRIKPGDEVVCPAVTWPTTVYPIVNVGARPVLVDVDLENFGIDVAQVEEALTRRTKAVLPVHLMGNPCEIDKIKSITDDHGYHLIEDACEAHGAKFGNKYVGSFGTCSAFSFYISHHITTIEGGMLLSDNEDLLEIAASQRSHGWVREMRNPSEISSRYPHIDSRFLFYHMGFNLRPTEIQAAFGIHQLPKLERFVEIRSRIAKYWNSRLAKFKEYLILPGERPGTRNSYFAYPLTIRRDAPFSRKELLDYLASRLIDTRPIEGGNLAEQPSASLYKHRVVGNLKNSKLIMRNSFFIGLHAGIKRPQQDYVVECLEEFFSNKLRRSHR